MIYKNKLRCYACEELDYLSNNCPRKKNLYNIKSLFLECTNEELVEVDENISDTETIYSIVSIKDKKENSESDNKDFNTESDLSRLEFMNTTCEYSWKKNSGLDSIKCFKCKWFPDILPRAKCTICFLERCIICIEEYFPIYLNENQPIKEKTVKYFSLEERIVYLKNEIDLLKDNYYDLNKKLEKYLGKHKLEEIS